MHRSVVQVDASQGRRERDTGSYVDRGERSEAPPGRRRYVPDSWRRALVKIATSLANQRALWEPLVAYDPVARDYVRLAREHEFEAWLLILLPGQGTDWHDHGGSAGAFITLRGVLTERHAEVGYGSSRIVTGGRELAAGTLRSFGSRHIHQVSNRGLEPGRERARLCAVIGRDAAVRGAR
jgi:Cysteine dioxygenase type I